VRESVEEKVHDYRNGRKKVHVEKYTFGFGLKYKSYLLRYKPINLLANIIKTLEPLQNAKK